ncbi:DUF7424 family protein [Pelistega suis]|uniref:DUF7424 domain-containing protein n=1 Tax=Pelistega suis TaxID=1631957 RepID=A0A849P2I7_9BURK|nr:hypothetical protein [Pelistega suis]NOL51680.1 hypothetical protein [Pelistega suis]
MLKLFKYSLIASAVVLAGCKVEAELEATHSELFSETQHEKIGSLYVEVAGCKHYEDSRQESDSLVKLKEAIQKYLPSTEYVECFSKKMDSFAHFKIPYAVGGKTSDIFENIKVTAIPSDPEGTSNQAAVMVTKKFKKALKDIKKENMMSNLKTSLSIKYQNNSDDTIEMTPLSVWMDDTPIVIGNVDSPPKATAIFKLSEIHSEILTGDGEQQISIFLDGYTKKK